LQKCVWPYFDNCMIIIVRSRNFYHETSDMPHSCFLFSLYSQVTQLEDYARARQPAPRLKRNGNSSPSSSGGGGFSGSATEKVSPLLVGVVDCLWNAVVGNSPSTARFLAVGGLDALLNLLEVSKSGLIIHSHMPMNWLCV